jgi:hypothetical protein
VISKQEIVSTRKSPVTIITPVRSIHVTIPVDVSTLIEFVNPTHAKTQRVMTKKDVSTPILNVMIKTLAPLTHATLNSQDASTPLKVVKMVINAPLMNVLVVYAQSFQ